MSSWPDEWLKNYPRAAAAVLVLVAFAVYAGSLANGFVYDDVEQVLQNPFVLNQHLWPKIFTGSVWSFQGAGFPTNFYRPLHIFSHWLVYRLAGPNPAAFHLFQLLMYAATVWLVYRVGHELLRNEVAAFAGALLWALHPLHVEAVAWIAALPDIGYGFFYLLGFLAFLRAEKSAGKPAMAHALAALVYFPALFFKETAVSFPLLLVAYGLFAGSHPSGVGWRQRALRWTPYLLAVSVYLAIRVAALGYVVRTPQPWRISVRMLGAAVALLGEHTRIFLWPTHLNVFRTFEPGPSLHSPWPWLTLLALLGTLGLRKRQPVLGFLVAWWAIALLPCLDIRYLSFPLLAERFSYVPSVGLCLAVSSVLIAWLPARLPDARPARIALPALVALMALYAVQTVRAVPHWRDNTALTSYSLQQSPNAALLHVAQAEILQFRDRDLEGAVREFQTALQLNSASVRPLAGVTYNSYFGLGMIALQRGRAQEAVGYLEKATRVLPNHSPAYKALGSVYFPRGDYAKASKYFAQAVKVNPQDLGARFYLGACLMKLGKHREAAEQFRAAREVDPAYQQAYEAEARALEAMGDSEAASRVRRLIPDQ